MTDKVNPSINRPAEAFKTAGAIAKGGGGSTGHITPAGSPTELSVQDGGINEADLNAFPETSSGSSFDVDIGGGEAYIYGSWCAIDTSTTVTLAASTNNQTVYVGWNKDGTDDVIVGLASAFDNASGNTDKKIELYDFDTDGSGVTNVTDLRTIGKTLDGRLVQNTNSVSTNYTTDGEQILFVDSTSSAVTITLSTKDRDDGNEIIVVDSGGAAGTNGITIDTEGSATINGNTSTLLDTDYGAQALGADGTNWYTTGAGGSGVNVQADLNDVAVTDMGTITLTSGNTPAFDGVLNGVSTDEQVKIREVNVYPDSGGQIAGDYAWNIDYGRAWDNSVPEVDLNLTVNWDNDPGSNITARVEVVTN